MTRAPSVSGRQRSRDLPASAIRLPIDSSDRARASADLGDRPDQLAVVDHRQAPGGVLDHQTEGLLGRRVGLHGDGGDESEVAHVGGHRIGAVRHRPHDQVAVGHDRDERLGLVTDRQLGQATVPQGLGHLGQGVSGAGARGPGRHRLARRHHRLVVLTLVVGHRRPSESVPVPGSRAVHATSLDPTTASTTRSGMATCMALLPSAGAWPGLHDRYPGLPGSRPRRSGRAGAG